MKKFVIFILLVALIPGLARSKPRTALTVLEAKGEPVENEAYVQLVRQELEDILMQTMQVSRERAAEALKTKSFTVRTAYDPQVDKALADACKESLSDLEVGGAITDLKGNLLAVYSSGKENNALRRGSPYGTLTPLSVYAPAFEKGSIRWNTQFEDSGYMLIDDGSGSVRYWPSPAGEDYTYKSFFAYQALRKPINTVTVRCLAQLGTENALSFLEGLGMDMTTERQDVQKNGADAALSDLVFGYVARGVTPVDMAGYYQIFANGGKYEAPKAVQELCDSEGNVLYSRVTVQKQVVSATTADLMNQLLQGVVENGGTGSAAAVKGLQVAGKTGSGSGSNWFVGVTPGYSIDLWHDGTSGNLTPKVFAKTAQSLYEGVPEIQKHFITHASIKQLMICSESGMAVSENCSRIEIGYFADKDIPQVCDQHLDKMKEGE